MDTSGVQSLIDQIDSFLQKKIRNNTRSQEAIEDIRQRKVIEVTVHSNTTELVNIAWLEEKFKNEGGHRRVVPSHDILQYTAKFPLNETSDSFLDKLHEEFDKRMQDVEAIISEKSPLIDEEISNNLTKQEAARNIAELFECANECVKKQLRREIENVLKDDEEAEKKAGIIRVLKATYSQGIEIALKKENKAKWGALNNRRGQIGENRTVAAMANILENFVGISVMGMKTHTFLGKFLQSLDIQLTYRNEYDPVTNRMTKANEVEHDNVSTWIEEDTFVIAIVESKVMEIKPSKSNFANETQAAVKHAKHALNQILKDFQTFKEICPDISEHLLNKIRYDKDIRQIYSYTFLIQI